MSAVSRGPSPGETSLACTRQAPTRQMSAARLLPEMPPDGNKRLLCIPKRRQCRNIMTTQLADTVPASHCRSWMRRATSRQTTLRGCAQTCLPAVMRWFPARLGGAQRALAEGTAAAAGGTLLIESSRVYLGLCSLLVHGASEAPSMCLPAVMRWFLAHRGRGAEGPGRGSSRGPRGYIAHQALEDFL